MAQKKNKLIPYVLIGVGLVGAFLIYKGLRKKKKEGELSEPVQDKKDDIITPPSVFPLKKGSRGSKVKELQNAILKVNPTALPKFGADGDFGSETESAVLYLLNKKTIDRQQDIENIKKLQKPTTTSGSTSGGYTPTTTQTTSGQTGVGRPTSYGTTYSKFETTASVLNVRKTPSTSAEIVAKLNRGSVVFAKPSSTSGWSEYSSDGVLTNGYVSSTYLKAI